MAVSSVKVVIIYPRPKDEELFERLYKEEHLPLAESKLKGMSRLVSTKVLHSPQGKVQVYRIAEIHFPSMDDLNRCLESEDGKEVIAHGAGISTGGPPILLVCEEQALVFW
jgi:uncharacterized protein (TIGR02118 family)